MLPTEVNPQHLLPPLKKLKYLHHVFLKKANSSLCWICWRKGSRGYYEARLDHQRDLCSAPNLCIAGRKVSVVGTLGTMLFDSRAEGGGSFTLRSSVQSEGGRGKGKGKFRVATWSVVGTCGLGTMALTSGKIDCTGDMKPYACCHDPVALDPGQGHPFPGRFSPFPSILKISPHSCSHPSPTSCLLQTLQCGSP